LYRKYKEDITEMVRRIKNISIDIWDDFTENPFVYLLLSCGAGIALIITSFIAIVISFVLGIQWSWFADLVESIATVLYYLAIGCAIIVTIIIGFIICVFLKVDGR
jgi:hypothetical protein